MSGPEDRSHEAVFLSFFFFSQDSRRFDTLDIALPVSVRDHPVIKQTPDPTSLHQECVEMPCNTASDCIAALPNNTAFNGNDTSSDLCLIDSH